MKLNITMDRTEVTSGVHSELSC